MFLLIFSLWCFIEPVFSQKLEGNLWSPKESQDFEFGGNTSALLLDNARKKSTNL